ncbi:MAG TPA: hypothetical protein D7I05_01010 [Candidatus Poseidoniales archaeon]|nr:MAG TPA: hypothetical protein D7I05_01010 [Candidatus Poseidoniales archaeon]|tara:strand:- start:2871 stop:3449 length:579 start_codon:yes stop_codon:yes gene_type:complete
MRVSTHIMQAVCVALILLPFASAHGVDKPDEDEENEEQAGMDNDHADSTDGLDHTTVMAIAYAASSLTFLFVWLRWSESNMVFPPHVIGFAKYSGLVHLLLGLQDPLLLLGGLGVFGLLAAPVVMKIEGSKATMARVGMVVLLASMFVAYFASSHGGSFFQDTIGLTTKAAEVLAIASILLLARSKHLPEEE